MNSNVRNLVLWLVILCLVALVWAVVKTGKPQGVQPGFSALVQDVKAGKVEKITLNSVTGDVHGKYKNGDEFTSTVPHTYNDFTTLLIDKGVAINVEKDAGGNWVSILVNAIPFVLLVGFWVFMMRQMQSGGNKALSFGKSRARLHSSQQKKVTFKDVAGVEEAKEELQEIIEFLREPQKFQKAGRAHSQGRVAGRARPVPARPCWPAPSRAKPTCRSSPFRVRTSSKCSWASARAACAICSSRARRTLRASSFIDEIDAVGRHRGAGLGGGHDEREQTLNQLLVEMDGFESNEGVILVAATNRPDVLDPALLRPGRFDRRVVGRTPRRQGPRTDSQGSYQESSARRRRGSVDDRARHSGLRRRRSGEPGE